MTNPQPQVGPGKFKPTKAPSKVPTTTNPLPKLPVPTATPTAADSTLVAKINKSLADKGLPQINVEAVAPLSLLQTVAKDPVRIAVIGKMLKARGKTVGASKEAIQNLFATEPELIKIAADAGNDYNKLVSLLNADFIPELGKKEAAPAFTGPSRSIYKYTDDDLDLLIKNVYQTAAMRLPSAEELTKERAKIRPELEKGTVSTTKFVKNAKGVMEQVTVQEGGPTKEAVATSIEERLKQQNPDDIDRAARIGFSSWISQNAAGA
jgi:hypothetical protein